MTHIADIKPTIFLVYDKFNKIPEIRIILIPRFA